MLVQAVWEAGFNPADIKYLIHSHEHFDHIGAADEFRDLYGCKLVISRAGADVMRERPELVYLKASPNPYATLFTPDLELEDGQVLTLGNTSIRCVLTPGHSPGVMSFFFDTCEDGRTYHVGYFGGAGFNTLYREKLLADKLPLSMRETFLESCRRCGNTRWTWCWETTRGRTRRWPSGSRCCGSLEPTRSWTRENGNGLWTS